MNLRDHLNERNLNVGYYWGVYPDDQEGVVAFLLWNLSGQLVGYQNYRPGASKERKNHPREGRYYTRVGDQHPLAVWGIESLYERGDILVITEGIFDACKLHWFGIPAIAVLGSNTKVLRNWLTCTGRKVYKVDDDHASKLGPYESLKIPEHRTDLGDCCMQEVTDMLIEKDLI